VLKFVLFGRASDGKVSESGYSALHFITDLHSEKNRNLVYRLRPICLLSFTQNTII